MLPKMNEENIRKRYEQARSVYSAFEVDTDDVCRKLAGVPLSLHCWQGDDVGGFESDEGLTGGGIQATGSYPGKARTADELRDDLEVVFRLVPGKLRLNLHAMYAETGGKTVARDELQPEHFQKWMSWAGKRGIGLDFNPSFFSHPLADDGFTLSSPDSRIRSFWIRHGAACRRIGEAFGRELSSPCITNIWIPDGYKDRPADRLSPRKILKDSLDAVLEETLDSEFIKDAVESKLFGIGSEAYVVGSHEFYLAYVMERKTVLLCLDAGHFHPTESAAEKISSLLPFQDELLLHVSRPVRWDSDHVVTLNDELRATCEEIGRCRAYDRVHLALDFFDASINRIAAWTVGSRALLKALLLSLLEPTVMLQEEERNGNWTRRLALMEELKALPFGAVWDYYCIDSRTPPGWAWLEHVEDYEKEILSKRG